METNGDGGKVLEFLVSNEKCIGCAACAHEHSSLFKMVEDKALAYTTMDADSVRAHRVVRCCPVDAISLLHDETTAEVQDISSLEVVAGWEDVWARHMDETEDLVERERRYGRVAQMSNLGKGSHLLRVELPRTLPRHKMIYMYGIEREAPDYDTSVEQIGPATLSVRARLTDPKLRFVAGKFNSFPVSLRMDFTFPAPVETFYERLAPDSIEVHAFEESVRDPAAQLRKVMLASVA